jgi:hypothetical protein
MTFHLFGLSQKRTALSRALKAAVAAHRPSVLLDLLASHGATAFASASSRMSARVLADLLSMLPSETCVRVLCRLPRSSRRVATGIDARLCAHPNAAERYVLPLPNGLLVWGRRQ